MNRIVARVLISALASTVLVLVSVFYVDRPLALYAATFHLDQGLLASTPVTSPVLLGIAIVAVAIGAAPLVLQEVPPPWLRKWAVAAILSGLALSWGVCLTEFLLKPLFARDVPGAFLVNGVYGFHWFATGPELGSFPSGHAVQIAAIATVLWFFYPRWRYVWILAVMGVAVALILAERHFLSDIIAGTATGVAAGCLLVAIWRAHVARDG